MSQQSKFLSLILRHQPELVGMALETGGWVRVDNLLKGMAAAGQGMSMDELTQIVAESDKKRFTLSPDRQFMRAAQGHSIAVDLDLVPIIPPKQLFHGTAKSNLDAIFADGLKPGKRQHVHLSSDHETAIKVGQRHGKPVILRVDTGRMQGDGHIFWQADNGVWLTDAVPATYLSAL